jgi:ribosome maturation protein SDO1
MTNVVARIKRTGKHYEIMVDVDKALEFKKTKKGFIREIISIERVFHDGKKGTVVAEDELKQSFGTDDFNAIAEKIILEGEIQVPLEYKRQEVGQKLKQIIDFLSKNAIDPRTNNPHTPRAIEQALSDAGVSVDNRPLQEQIPKILEKLKPIIPIKIKTKKIKLKVMAQDTGKVYGLITPYKEREEWLPDGSLQCIINIPSGLQSEFYDKLNAITHGSALTEEIKTE